MVIALHKLTGKLQEVPSNYIDMFPALVEATEQDIDEAQRALEIATYGAPLNGKDISEIDSSGPDSNWRKGDLQAFADAHGIEVASDATKGQILEAINDVQEGA